MHHITFCTPCITIFNYDHLLHMRVDHVEPKSGIQMGQVQKEYDGPQMLSCMDTNLDGIKVSPSASNHHP
jgi:hypothetical protein